MRLAYAIVAAGWVGATLGFGVYAGLSGVIAPALAVIAGIVVAFANTYAMFDALYEET